MLGANVGSEHHLLMAKVRIKIAKLRKERSCGVRFDVTNLSDGETRGQFKLVLQNRFECLQQLEVEEPTVDDEWRQIEVTGRHVKR